MSYDNLNVKKEIASELHMTAKKTIKETDEV